MEIWICPRNEIKREWRRARVSLCVLCSFKKRRIGIETVRYEEREILCVYVCVRERERMCVREREKERERE